jgi:hypothetical protein
MLSFTTVLSILAVLGGAAVASPIDFGGKNV